MITMRLLLLSVLLSGVLAIGRPGGAGPVEESLVTEPSSVQDGPDPSLGEDDSSEQNKLVGEKGDFVNVSDTTVKSFSNASIKESGVQDDESNAVHNLPDEELKMPLSTVEEEEALPEDRQYLLTQDGQYVEENRASVTKDQSMKPKTYESKNKLSSSSQHEEVKLQNQEQEEKARVKLLTKEVWVIDPSIQDHEEENQSTLDEEKVSKPDNEPSLGEDKEMPQDEEESLVEDEEGVKKPLSRDDEEAKAWFKTLWEEVNEENNASDFAEEPEGDEQNMTSVPENVVDMEITSVPHMEDNEKIEDDDSYGMFVFEEYYDEDAVSQSQEEYDDDNTWLLIEEDDEDATSESEVEHDEMTWLAIDDEDNSNESKNGNSTVLISQSQDEVDKDGVQVDMEGTDEDATPNPAGGFDEILNRASNNGIGTGYDFSDQKNRNSQKEDTLSSHFYAYLVATAIIIIILYAVYHNNGKIIAFVMEKRSKGGWRASDANYQSLDNKV